MKQYHILGGILGICLTLMAEPVAAQSGRQRPQPPSGVTTSQPSNKPRRVEGTPAPAPTPTLATEAASVPVSAIPGATPDDILPPPPPPAPAAPRRVAAPVTVVSDDDEIIRVTSNLVAIPASILDGNGKPLTGLQLADFTLTVDGNEKPLTELNFSTAPVRLMMLFDNSSSQTAARELEKKAALKFFKRVLRSQDQAALIAIETEPRLIRNMTDDVNGLTKSIDEFGKPQGATALFDAVAMAAEYLKVHAGRRVIVIVSDGEDTISDTTFDLALSLAQQADCQIYAVQTGHIENANLRQLAGERRLEEFTAQTGGAVYVPQDVNDLDAAFNQIAADLAQQYVLSYYPSSEEPRDGSFHTLALTVKNQPQARIRARKGYYATPRRKSL